MASSSIKEEVRNYIVHIQQRLERGSQDDVSYDYILFRLDWVINLLVRLTSDEQNIENSLSFRELLIFFVV